METIQKLHGGRAHRINSPRLLLSRGQARRASSPFLTHVAGRPFSGCSGFVAHPSHLLDWHFSWEPFPCSSSVKEQHPPYPVTLCPSYPI